MANKLDFKSNEDNFGFDLDCLHEKLNPDCAEDTFDFDLEHLYERLMDNQNTLDQPMTSIPIIPVKKKSQSKLFPSKLYEMLQNNTGSDIISWYLDGTGFKINNTKKFESNFLPKYFLQTKIRSFQRQMNIYGFKSIGSYKYKHPSFIRNKPHFLGMIKRVPIKKKNYQTRYLSNTSLKKINQTRYRHNFNVQD